MSGIGIIVAGLGILGTLGKVGGIAGIALGVVAIILRDVIRKRIFPKLDDNHAFSLLRLIVMLAWSLGLAGLGTWAYGLWVEQARSQVKEEVVSGIVSGEDGKEITDALVVAIVQGEPLTQYRTTTSGRFRLTVSNAVSPIRIMVTKDGFVPWNDLVGMPQSEVRITLKAPPRALSRTKTTETSRSPLGKHPPAFAGAPPPSWEQVRADLMKEYSYVNGLIIDNVGTPRCEVKPDGNYCQQGAHVTMRSVDATLRCHEVSARYKLVKNEWRFESAMQESEGCSN